MNKKYFVALLISSSFILSLASVAYGADFFHWLWQRNKGWALRPAAAPASPAGGFNYFPRSLTAPSARQLQQLQQLQQRQQLFNQIQREELERESFGPREDRVLIIKKGKGSGVVIVESESGLPLRMIMVNENTPGEGVRYVSPLKKVVLRAYNIERWEVASTDGRCKPDPPFPTCKVQVYKAKNGSTIVTPDFKTQCSDGLDNDGDGKTNLDDPDCSDSSDDSESPDPDTTSPIISGVNAGSITKNSAVISWTTNEDSTSQVEYGLTVNYGSQTDLDSSLVASHEQKVTGLSEGVAYHFRVKSNDAAGNEAVSKSYSFTTLKASAPKVVIQKIGPPPFEGYAAMGKVTDLQKIAIRADKANTEFTDITRLNVEQINKTSGDESIAFENLLLLVGGQVIAGPVIAGPVQLSRSDNKAVAYFNIPKGNLRIAPGELYTVTLRGPAINDNDLSGKEYRFRFFGGSGEGVDSRESAVISNQGESGPRRIVVRTELVLEHLRLGVDSGRERNSTDQFAKLFFTPRPSVNDPQPILKDLTFTLQGSALANAPAFGVRLVNGAGNNWGESVETSCAPEQAMIGGWQCSVTLNPNATVADRKEVVLVFDSSNFSSGVGEFVDVKITGGNFSDGATVNPFIFPRGWYFIGSTKYN